MAATTNGTGGEGGRTQVQRSSAPAFTEEVPRQAVLHLRGMNAERGSQEEQDAVGEEDVTTPGGTQRRIQWADSVIDNEGMGRKKSKVCCIYHPPRPIDESSNESSSDSSSNESESGDNGSARPTGSGRRNKDHSHSHDHEKHGQRNGKGKDKGRKGSPNAYERQPQSKPKDGAQMKG